MLGDQVDHRATRAALKRAVASGKSDANTRLLEAEDAKLAALDEPGFGRASQQIAQILDALREVDDAPTAQLVATIEEKMRWLADLLAAWPKAKAHAVYILESA